MGKLGNAPVVEIALILKWPTHLAMRDVEVEECRSIHRTEPYLWRWLRKSAQLFHIGFQSEQYRHLLRVGEVVPLPLKDLAIFVLHDNITLSITPGPEVVYSWHRDGCV